MSIFPRAVTARLIERLIFNFRLRPDEFAAHLPVPWLQPQIINGWSVASFCILKLQQVIIWPLPGWLGLKTTSCAYRCGVIDTSDGNAEPSVYITDRNTDLPIIARLAPWWFSDTIPMVRFELIDTGILSKIQINYLDRQRLFYAEARDSTEPGHLNSEVFNSVASFATFIHAGISSYTPSIYGDALAKVDLVKEDPVYVPLDAIVDFSWLDGTWSDAKLTFDSAVRATGGIYKWTYRGLRSEI